ncbi:MAG: hypothetical protein JKY19_09820 [Alcanivoracaceae bacterium]|nr:hypothetical protein [Alcanivoracaceae bacterium]
MHWKLSLQFSKITGFGSFLPRLLAGVLFISQLSYLPHQLSHINDSSSDVVCLECISSPDKISNNSVTSTIDKTFDFPPFHINLTSVVTSHTEVYYSSRAPPNLLINK